MRLPNCKLLVGEVLKYLPQASETHRSVCLPSSKPDDCDADAWTTLNKVFVGDACRGGRDDHVNFPKPAPIPGQTVDVVHRPGEIGETQLPQWFLSGTASFGRKSVGRMAFIRHVTVMSVGKVSVGQTSNVTVSLEDGRNWLSAVRPIDSRANDVASFIPLTFVPTTLNLNFALLVLFLITYFTTFDYVTFVLTTHF